MWSQPSIFQRLRVGMRRIAPALRRVAGCALGGGLMPVQPAAAQTVNRYSNPADSAVGGISDAGTPCTEAG